MSKAVCVSLHDKAIIAQFARRHAFMHLYELGDLDDFFWPHTVWYGWQVAGHVQQLALVYTPFDVPVLIANADPPVHQMQSFMKALLPLLPRRVYAHLDPSVIAVLQTAYQVEPHGMYNKMGLTDREAIYSAETSDVVPLQYTDLAAIQTLYSAAYPGNWFDQRMLATQRYFGVWHEHSLISVAGVHVYAPTLGVAALGNITTHPEWRGRGLALRTTAALCQELLNEGIHSIGLNVKSNNHAAIRCYERLGFEHVGVYGEYMLEVLPS
jgi:predicted GNAT family acetyltransferase